MSLGQANLAIAAAFVLVFVSIGTWYIQRSEAAGCLSQTFSIQNPGGYGNICVKAIQSMLDNDRIGSILKTCPYPDPKVSYTCNKGYYDGIFGSKTAADVRIFQLYSPHASGYPRLKQDGVVGLSTWTQLCLVAEGNSPNDFNRAGCSALFSHGLF